MFLHYLVEKYNFQRMIVHEIFSNVANGESVARAKVWKVVTQARTAAPVGGTVTVRSDQDVAQLNSSIPRKIFGSKVNGFNWRFRQFL